MFFYFNSQNTQGVLTIFTDDISAGGLLILAFIIRPVVSFSVATSFIRNLMNQAYMTLSDLILTHLFMPYLPLKEFKSIFACIYFHKIVKLRKKYLAKKM
jgi:hypothetical protein